MDPLSLLLQPPVFYPVVPYACTIFGGLQHGRMILVQGTVGISAVRFQIDFQCGCSTRPRSDIAFHFNPRFSSSDAHVICNTLRKNQWLDEFKFSGLPLRKGESFVLLFLFLADKVKVSVGGQHFLDFHYRLPLQDVDTLGISGEVTVKEISFLSSNPYHDTMTEYPLCQPLKPGNLDLNLPISKRLPLGLSEGHMILARGFVTGNPEELTFSLKSKNLIPFKLTASFKDESLYYNYCIGESWGDPQKIQTPFFVFHAERYFEDLYGMQLNRIFAMYTILVLPESGVFRLAINGTPLGDFCPPALDLKSIDEFQINGIGSALIYSIKC
ncbi:galectin-12 isoform X2 [Bufo bufo]|uniref:galectin-12 isoform X2 n=1 Tax=Bufo bufo TaxID=8384 RepID=UPI001ABDDD1A|nr:galectin-12 isoform X2 [Bufo bufo]